MTKTVAELAQRWLPHKAGGLSDAERRVLESALERTAVAVDIGRSHADRMSIGDRLADSLARVGGSWAFIVGFLVFLMLWTALNTVVLLSDAFDPYPFIFLNLVLSMIAAIQAPVIMMSQNRQAARDRLDAAHDYEVNLKAEIEIMALHEKLDTLRHHELLAMRDDISKIANAIQNVEMRLAAGRG